MGFKRVLETTSLDQCEWATPAGLFEELNNEFHFTLDPCATAQNAKCVKFFTEEDDGLAQSWDGETVFCNPPYGRNTEKWVKKAFETRTETAVVLLVPARTDTRWFHEYINGKAEVRFIRGRLKYNDGYQNAPFPSMIVVYRPKKQNEEKKHGEWLGYTRSKFYGTDDWGEPIFRDGVVYYCSNCRRRTVVKENYCPRCGSRMDRGEN